MANTAQTSAATAAEQETIKAIEQKLSGLSSIMEGFKNGMTEFAKVMTDEKSQFFQNMSSIMFGSMQRNDADRRAYEEAKAQHEETRKMAMGARGPERGQAGFWEAAFAATPDKPEEIQARATIKALTSDDVKKHMQEAFSTATIKNAVSEGDSRTTGEKALDFMGLGFINKIKNRIQDRDIIHEEKANKKDKDSIARDMREKARLEAAIRKAKGPDGTGEDAIELVERLREVNSNIKDAEGRLDARKRAADPYSDLIEGDGLDARFIDGKGVVIGDSKGKLADTLDNPSSPLKVTDSKSDKDDDKKRSISGVDEEAAAEVEYELNTKARPDFYKEGTEAFKAINDGELSSGIASSVSSGLMSGVGSGVGKGIADSLMPTFMDKAKSKFFRKDAEGAFPSGETGDAKEIADTERYLNTQLRPDFYKEGIRAFKVINSGKLKVGEGESGNNESLIDTFKDMVPDLPELPGKQKVKEVVDFIKEGPNGASKNIKAFLDSTVENLENSKRGWDNEQKDAMIAHTKAEKELEEGKLFGFTMPWQFRQVAKVKKAKVEMDEASKKFGEFTKAARERGISFDDQEAMMKFKDEYDHAKGGTGTAGNAGKQMPPNATTPGESVDPRKSETADEKTAREEETLFRAVKRALTDVDVQKQNLENAKVTGQQIDQSLTGRK